MWVFFFNFYKNIAAKSLKSCLTLCDPIDGSPPGSAVPGILQARTLEWVAIAFSSAWKWKVKVKSLSCVRRLATPWTAAHQAPPSMGFSRQEYWSGVPLPSPNCCNHSTKYIRFLYIRLQENHADEVKKIKAEVENLRCLLVQSQKESQSLKSELQTQKEANSRAPTTTMRNLVERLKSQLALKEKQQKVSNNRKLEHVVECC